MKIPSIFRNNKWPSCNYPKTTSFGATTGEDIFKTVNSVFFDSVIDGVQTPNSFFTNSSETTSFSTDSEEFDGASLEVVVRSVRSERLFYEPDDTSSIVAKAKDGGFRLEESVVMSMESEDPYGDFKRSIEEMVESHRIQDWDCLEELLGWYLKVNGKKNHGFIVEAFVDVLVGIAESAANYSDSSTTFISAVSSFSHSSSVNGGNHEIQEDPKFLIS
ncbi:transcription repressor OFP13 [Euphorbia lathyris]|uniref:transcription repressor OFP13 n=1 Tax=Euphorbia lathyris TaxID=212925 RepID=UPI0033140ECB